MQHSAIQFIFFWLLINSSCQNYTFFSSLRALLLINLIRKKWYKYNKANLCKSKNFTQISRTVHSAPVYLFLELKQCLLELCMSLSHIIYSLRFLFTRNFFGGKSLLQNRDADKFRKLQLLNNELQLNLFYLN